jgi:Holliday junction resolvase RusA-like endonuclease
MIQFFVEGDPVPKQSFRVVEKRSGKTHGYADPRVTAWQGAIGYKANQYCDKQLDGKLWARLEFYLSNNRIVDLDNLSKAVLDGMKGIVYKDDNQVYVLHLSKQVNKENPGVMVYIDNAVIE